MLRTVFLVLQSDGFRYAVQEVLKEHYHIITAQNAALGAELLYTRPDILILDLFLSGTNGFHFLEKNRGLIPPTVVLFTTLINPQILHTASDLCVDAIFRIPCSISAVLKRLESLT